MSTTTGDFYEALEDQILRRLEQMGSAGREAAKKCGCLVGSNHCHHSG